MTPRNKDLRLVAIVAALSLALAACAQDDGTTASSDTSMDPGTATTDTVGDTATTVSTTTDTSTADDAIDEDLQEINAQAAVISTHVAEADVEEVTEGWTVIEDHLNQLTTDGFAIDDSLVETISADLDALDTTIQGYESTLSSEFVTDWEAFHAGFQAVLSVTG